MIVSSIRGWVVTDLRSGFYRQRLASGGDAHGFQSVGLGPSNKPPDDCAHPECSGVDAALGDMLLSCMPACSIESARRAALAGLPDFVANGLAGKPADHRMVKGLVVARLMAGGGGVCRG